MMLLALAVLAVPSDPIYQLEAEPGQYATVPLFPSGTHSGYKFTVTRRPDGRLPSIKRLLHATSDRIRIYVKLSNDKYGLYFDWNPHPSSPVPHGVLLPEGEYLASGQAWGDGTALLGGSWIDENTQDHVWTLKAGATSTQTINLADGTTVVALPFTVDARKDGAIVQVLLSLSGNFIYKQKPGGDYIRFGAAGSFLPPGSYAIPRSAPAPMSPGDYEVVLSGRWVVPQ